MKRILRSAVSLLLCAAVALGGTACGRSKLPTTITIWTYYNGDQLECFNQLVEQFNSTVGKEKNIRVESSSQGSVNDLETSVLAAAEGKVGAEKLPNIVSSYADTAFTLDQMGLAVDLNPYLTEKEKSAYIAGFLEEGDLMNNGELKVFPIAKSTELLYLNTTDFAPFAEATGVDLCGSFHCGGAERGRTQILRLDRCPDGCAQRRQGPVWPRRADQLPALRRTGTGYDHL